MLSHIVALNTTIKIEGIILGPWILLVGGWRWRLLMDTENVGSGIGFKAGETWGRLESDMEHIKGTQVEILAAVQKTNGRVTALEKWRDRMVAGFLAICLCNPFATAWLVDKTPAERQAVTQSVLQGICTNKALQSAVLQALTSQLAPSASPTSPVAPTLPALPAGLHLQP